MRYGTEHCDKNTLYYILDKKNVLIYNRKSYGRP